MAATTKSRRKNYPLSMRLPESDIAMIDRAARLRGRSRTDFVREAAVHSAEQVLMENTLMRMSPAAFNAFSAAIAAPARVVPEIVKLLKHRAPWIPAAKGE